LQVRSLPRQLSDQQCWKTQFHICL
jgi:hypothetical protein